MATWLCGVTLLLGLPASGICEEAGVARALVIGVDSYTQVPKLNGAVNDAKSMRALLIDQFGLAAQNVRLMTNAEATRKAILAALKELVAAAGPDETVLVFFAGHGSQVRDLDGDESDDQKDETLVPQDGRTKGIADITDDELAAILSAGRERQTIVILDSCHSGTATRSVEVQTRSVPEDTRVALYPATIPGVGKRGEGNMITMTAADAAHSAYDGPIDGEYRGFFTYALVSSLSQRNDAATPRDLLSQTSTILNQLKSKLSLTELPDPQLEGPSALLDAPFLGAARARLRTVPVERKGAGSEVALIGARRLGGAPGSSWAVYGPRETAFDSTKRLATVDVTATRGDDALGKLVPATAVIPAGARAALYAAPSSADVARIGWINGSADERAAISRRVKKVLPGARFVERSEFPIFLLERASSGWSVFGADGVSIIQSISSSDPTQVGSEVAQVVSRGMRAADLLALDNPMGAFELSISVAPRDLTRGVQIVGDDPAPAPVSPSAHTAEFRIRAAQSERTPGNSLQLVVQSSADCFLSIAHVDQSGEIHVIFPNPLSEQKGYLARGQIRGGQPVSIPDSLASGNKAGFFLDVSDPPGIDSIKAFCHKSVEGAQALRSILGGGSTATRSGDAPDLGERLRSALLPRGISLVADAGVSAPPPHTSDWASASLVLRVSD